MSLFLITFLTIYGGMHAYAFYRLKHAFQPAPGTARGIAAIMLLMTFMPLVIRLTEWSGFEDLAIILAWPGYIWMGALFLFASALTCTDLIRFMTWLIIRRSGSGMPECLGARLTCEVALILSLSATTYSIFEARNIRTEHLTVTSRKLPATAGRIRVVQISDVHLGLLVREDRLKRILAKVTEARPDILVSTGDLVDGRLNRQGTLDTQGRLARMLAAVKAPLGSFAVTGNHEFYAGINQALAFTAASGFKILRNETQSVGAYLSITGVDDPAVNGRDAKENYAPEAAQLRSADVGRFRLLLKHRPLVSPSSDGLFDLQLSGHAHDGQIFPFTLLVLLKYHLAGGTATTTASSLFHVSRGSGTWGPPLRFLAPPEVTVIDIVPAK